MAETWNSTTSASVSDWKSDRIRYGRNAWILQPSYWAVAVYRFGRWTRRAPRIVAPFFHGLYFFGYCTVRLATGIDIPRTAEFGPGLLIHHFGGIIIHPQSRIGARCTLRQGVTIGSRRDGEMPPQIGDDVEIGAYAQILGDIFVGSRTRVGALTLVLKDVQPDSTMVGIPARSVTSDSTS
jgi:serine O-acetyltransferase